MSESQLTVALLEGRTFFVMSIVQLLSSFYSKLQMLQLTHLKEFVDYSNCHKHLGLYSEGFKMLYFYF